MDNKIKVMLSTEGTYPFHQGGVSTWCDILINNLKNQADFYVYSIVMNPFVNQKFDLPNGVKITKLPLWGTEEPSEHLSSSFSQIYLKKKRTTDEVVKNQFIPLFFDMVSEILSPDKDPIKFGVVLFKLHNYFTQYDYMKSFKHEMTWDLYKNIITSLEKENKIIHPGVYSTVHSLGWLYRFMNVLNTPVPDVDVTHSAAAAFCSVPCVIAKLKNKTPFILTEHGVYLREQYLSLSKRGLPEFLNLFLIRMIHSITLLSYAYADKISPVCEYNTRWEKRLGAASEKIQVIYNGIDTGLFLQKGATVKSKNPTVVTVARVDPLKDIITLINTCNIVKKEIPNIKFIVYGSVSVLEYFEECKKLVKKLKLTKEFIFAGHTGDVATAYSSGDIVALSSISEGFPYSVVEAMMTGKPVVSTDVGGIKEALEDCGMLVPPRNSEKFAKCIVSLLKDPEMCAEMGERARERALKYFNIKRVQKLYYDNYIYLGFHENLKAKVFDNEQTLLIMRADALIEYGYENQAITLLEEAISIDNKSKIVPLIISKIADAYNRIGDYYKAFNELDKLEALICIGG